MLFLYKKKYVVLPGVKNLSSDLREIDGWMNEQVGKQKDRWMNEQMDGQTDGWIDR